MTILGDVTSALAIINGAIASLTGGAGGATLSAASDALVAAAAIDALIGP